MSKRTVTNEKYSGVVENFSIPAELHERDGKIFASFGSAVPIHCCTPEQVTELARTTHHYSDIFTEQILAPLGELAYVRLDENTAEKVFINRSKRILVVSSDGELAQWRCAPTFESANRFVAGTPLVSHTGELVSLLTARHGNNYAVSTFDGDGGYFETSEPWVTVDSRPDALVYGDRTFPSREALRDHLTELQAAPPTPGAPRPALHEAPRSARLSLVAPGGRQVAHVYLQGVIGADVEYL